MTLVIVDGGNLAVLADGTKEYSIKDHLGSVRVVASTSGQLRQYDYKPFGDTLQSGSYNNLRGYEGGERDPVSRYLNLGARLYDPIIGRFLSVDPLWEAFLSWSPYQYAYNCPVSYKDPTGFAPQKEKGDRVMVAYNPWVEARLESSKVIMAREDFNYSDRHFITYTYYYWLHHFGISSYVMSYGLGVDKADRGNRTASWEYKGESFDEYGNLTGHLFDMHIPLSDGRIKTIKTAVSADVATDIHEAFQYMDRLSDGFNQILCIEPSYFDVLFTADIVMFITTDKLIADIYFEKSGIRTKILSGLCVPSQGKTSDLSIFDIYICSQVLDRSSNKHNYLYYDPKAWRSEGIATTPFTAWEVIAHEFAHSIDAYVMGYGLYKMINHERSAVERVNILRRAVGRKEEILPK